MGMTNEEIRQAWMESELAEEPVTVGIKGLDKANLIIRELPFGEGADLIMACTDKEAQTVDQKKLMMAILLHTLRNNDHPDKALVFSDADRDFVASKSLNAAFTAAQASINLSGLNKKSAEDAKKNSIPNQTNSTVAVDSLSDLPTN
jgi:hypothetical protein